MITRTAWLDWYLDGGESAVFVDGNVVVLSALATSLVRAVGDGAAFQQVVDVLEQEFGRPEGTDTGTAVQAAVDELRASGVLEP